LHVWQEVTGWRGEERGVKRIEKKKEKEKEDSEIDGRELKGMVHAGRTTPYKKAGSARQKRARPGHGISKKVSTWNQEKAGPKDWVVSWGGG